MSDVALQNAIARKDAIRTRLDSIDQDINQLMDARNRAFAELEPIRQFIDTWYEMAGIPNPAAAEQMQPNEPAPPRRPKNPDRELVVEVALALIDQAGKPLGRREIFERLPDFGIDLQGKDPEMVLSTMLWRSKDKIVRLPGYGYWFAQRDYGPADYWQIDGDDILATAAQEPEDGVEADDAD